MNRNTITLPTCNITNITEDLSTEESEIYIHCLQSLCIQFNINMDQDQESFRENELKEEEEDENPPQQDPPAIMENSPKDPHKERIPSYLK